ncbi:MAG: helix-turn-helix transcriptional regulator [Clostridiales bacterium]|nr:helix-turn-helix transcriptional regulator [Clostridiales bacterium]
MSKYMQRLSENLKDLMGEMSVTELSEKVKIPQPTLSRYLLCQRQITLDNLVILADYFNVDIDILIGRKDY